MCLQECRGGELESGSRLVRAKPSSCLIVLFQDNKYEARDAVSLVYEVFMWFTAAAAAAAAIRCHTCGAKEDREPAGTTAS